MNNESNKSGRFLNYYTMIHELQKIITQDIINTHKKFHDLQYY